MMNYTKAPDVSLDFQVAVSETGVKVVSPKIGMELNFKAMPEKKKLLLGAARAAYHHCQKNNIPIDGDTFVILACDNGLENGGNFQAMFVPDPAFRH